MKDITMKLAIISSLYLDIATQLIVISSLFLDIYQKGNLCETVYFLTLSDKSFSELLKINRRHPEPGDSFALSVPVCAA